MKMTSSEADRVAVAVKWRRSEIRRSRVAVGNVGGTSDQTVMNLEKGEQTSYRDRSVAAVEKGLGWPAGSIRQVIDGVDFRTIPHEPVVSVPVKASSDEDFDTIDEMARIYARLHFIRDVARARGDFGDAQRRLASHTTGEIEDVLAELREMWSDAGTNRLESGQGE